MDEESDFLLAKTERIKQRYCQKPSEEVVRKPELTDDEKEIVDGLKKELLKRIHIGSGPVEPLPPLQETEAVKRFAAAGFTLRAPPKPKIINYDSIIDEVVRKNPPKNLPPLTPLGNVDLLCPYCNAAFPKKPKAKTKCKSCGSIVFIRTRPYDDQKVLVTDVQADQISLEIELRRKIREFPENERIYQERISLLKQRLIHYQEAGYPGFRVISVCDERCSIEEVNYHGHVFKFGSKDMWLGIELLLKRDFRSRSIAWFGDSKFDTSPDQDAWCRYDWAIRALDALPESDRESERAQQIKAIIFRDTAAAMRFSKKRK